MTQKNKVTTEHAHSASLAKPMLIGAGIALMLIVLFLVNAGEPDPEWPRFWMIRPLIIVPFAGAMGGVFYHLVDRLRYQGGWKKVLANLASLIVYIVGLWLGTVLGLDGTMWD